MDRQRAASRPLYVRVLLVLSALSASPALAQLSVSPTSLKFDFVVGQLVPAAQTLVINGGTPSPISTTLTPSGSWLQVSPAGSGIFSSVDVSVNPAGLNPGTYNGTVTINSRGSPSVPVPVTLNITAPLKVDPASLAFNFVVGSSAPAAQPVSVTAAGTSMSYSAQVSTTGGGNWLVATPASSTTAGSMSVSVNVTGVAPGTYTGSITVSSAASSNGSQLISVTLNVTAPLSVDKSALTFNFAVGSGAPGAQAVSVTAAGASMSYSAQASTTSGGNWLAAAPASSTTAGSMSVSVNVAGLAPGTYSGSITVSSSTSSNGSQIISVTLKVTAPLSVDKNSLTFNFVAGGSAPAAQLVSVTAAGASMSYNAQASTTSGGAWLAAAPAGSTTAGPMSVSISPPAGLGPGSYNGTVTVSSQTASNTPIVVSVTLNVTAVLAADKTSLAFNFVVGGGAPAAQAVSVAAGGASLSYSAQVSTTGGGNWLAATPADSTTAGAMSVSVNVAGLAPGTYSGTVTVSSQAASNTTPPSISVTLNVTAPLSVDKNSLTFNFAVGGNVPGAQAVSVAAAGATMPYSAQVPGSANWLTATPASSTTAGPMSVSVNVAGLAPGTYSSTITVSSTTSSNGSLAISVTLNVTAPLLADKTSLTFNFVVGGSAAAAQAVSVTAAGASLSYGAQVSTTGGGNWLAATPASSTTAGSMSVSISPPAGLGPGSYNGTVTVSSQAASNTPIVVSVTLNVTALLTVDKTSLTFNFVVGGSGPSAQAVSVTAGGASLAYSAPVSTASAGNWLAATPATSTTAGAMSVSVNVAGLAPGTYNGTVTVSSQSASNTTPPGISVTLNVTAPLSVDKTSLTFNFVVGGNVPAAQAVSVTAAGASMAYGAQVTTASGGGWLAAALASTTTAGPMNVSVNPAGLAAGTYSGTIGLNSPTASNIPPNITVTLNVTAPLSVDKNSLAFSFVVGGSSPGAQQISVTSQGVSMSFNAQVSTTSGGAWLAAPPGSGTTGGSLSVSVNTSGLAPGTYSGAVTVSSATSSNGSQGISVSLTITAPLSVSSPSLFFNFVAGTTSLPAQTVNITSPGAGMAFNVTSSTQTGGSWLLVSASGGNTPGSVTISVNAAGIGSGVYNGTVTITSPTASNGPQTISVTLSVNVPWSVGPATLTFNYVAGDRAPPAQAITINSNGVSLDFTTAVPSDASWLSIPAGGNTATGSISVSVNPSGLAAGTYKTTVTFNAPGSSTGPQIVGVTLVITVPLTTDQPTLSFSAVAGAASPQKQQVNVTSKDVPATFSISVTTSKGGNWLSATSASLTTAATITVSVDLTGLKPDTYSGTVTISSPNAVAPQSVTVNLTVSPGDLILSVTNLQLVGNTAGSAPLAPGISVTSSNQLPTSFTVSAAITSGPSSGAGLAGAITVTPASATTPALVTATVNPTGLTPGQYQGSVEFTVPQNPKKKYVTTFTLVVNDVPPQLSVSPSFLDLQAAGGSSQPASQTPTAQNLPGSAHGNPAASDQAVSQTLIVQNLGGGGPLNFSATVTSGSTWLSVSPSSGVINGNLAVPIQVTADPQGLTAGPYQGTIHLQTANLSQDVRVSLLVLGVNPYIGLDFTGALFEARAGEGLVYARDVSVFNRGGGTLNWTAKLLTGGDYFSLIQKPGKLTLTAQPQNLDPGAYYGTVEVSDPNALNSPQLITVVLNVLLPNADAIPIPSPGGLLYVVTAGDLLQPSQQVQVFTSSASAAPFQAAAQTDDGAFWLSVSPASGLTSTGNTGAVNVYVNPAILTTGVFQGGVSISMGKAVRTVNVTVIAVPAGTTTKSAGQRLAGGCTPARLVPVYTGLVNNFSSPAGWPTPVTVVLADDCGNLVPNGNVVLGFSKGEPRFLTLNLSDRAKAIYSATWVPAAAASQVSVAAQANAGALSGTAQLTGAITDNSAPVLTKNGTLNDFAPQLGAPLAPGTVVQIFGANLAQDTVSPSDATLPTKVNGTQVLIGGIAAPLYFVSKAQINAQVPVELDPRSSYPVLVSVNGAITVPDTINLIQAAPGVAAFPSGQVIAQHGDFSLVTTDAPAAPGEAVVIYLVGMGATDPAVASGAAAPSAEPLARVKVAPAVSLDGQPVDILYAGLTPGAIGLYQINFNVPPNAASGNLALVVTQNGQQSNSVTLPVRSQ